MGKVLYAYFLAVALGWAAFPIIVIALSQYAQLYVVLSVYTFVVTLGIYLYSVHDDAWLRGIGQKTVPVGAL